MSCFIEFLPGGDPRREIFPLALDRIDNLQSVGKSEILAMLGVAEINELALNASQYIGAALKPDGTPFYLTTIAPDFGRTKDPVWLDRARRFAMTSIVQWRATQVAVGRGRYSLWTGDVGLAVYLWDCITGEPRFPTVDVF